MVTTSLLVSAGSWLIRRWGAVVGTTKYSEQSHVPNHDSKEKEFKLKENSGLKAHESFSESSILSRSSVVPILGVSSFGQAVGCGESALQIVSTGYGFTVYASSATSSPHRRTLRARVFRAGGLLGMIALLQRLAEPAPMSTA